MQVPHHHREGLLDAFGALAKRGEERVRVLLQELVEYHANMKHVLVHTSEKDRGNLMCSGLNSSNGSHGSDCSGPNCTADILSK